MWRSRGLPECFRLISSTLCLQVSWGVQVSDLSFLNKDIIFLWFAQTHHMQCPLEPENFKDLDCEVFDDPHHMTMALSVLVTIEMLNALNRSVVTRHTQRLSMTAKLQGPFSKPILHAGFCFDSCSICLFETLYFNTSFLQTDNLSRGPKQKPWFWNGHIFLITDRLYCPKRWVQQFIRNQHTHKRDIVTWRHHKTCPYGPIFLTLEAVGRATRAVLLISDFVSILLCASCFPCRSIYMKMLYLWCFMPKLGTWKNWNGFESEDNWTIDHDISVMS